MSKKGTTTGKGTTIKEQVVEKRIISEYKVEESSTVELSVSEKGLKANVKEKVITDNHINKDGLSTEVIYYEEKPKDRMTLRKYLKGINNSVEEASKKTDSINNSLEQTTETINKAISNIASGVKDTYISKENFKTISDLKDKEINRKIYV